jgi:protein tyrosine/serine phosphatase
VRGKRRLANAPAAFGIVAVLASLGCATVQSDQTSAPPKPKSASLVPAASGTSHAARQKTERWARPLAKPGLPNLHQVSDVYFRGAQPSAEGMRELARMKVKTVVNLRAMNSDRDEIGETALAYEHISFKAWHAEDEDVVRFLRIVTDPERQPVFVHCQHGADRTGMMTALYRIVVEGWTKDDAISEMTEGGYGFHSIWQDLVDYVREVDVERLRTEAGLSKATKAPAEARP